MRGLFYDDKPGKIVKGLPDENPFGKEVYNTVDLFLPDKVFGNTNIELLSEIQSKTVGAIIRSFHFLAVETNAAKSEVEGKPVAYIQLYSRSDINAKPIVFCSGTIFSSTV